MLNCCSHDNYLDLLPIGLLAFQAAGQVTLSRVLSFSDLPTIVISTLYHDYMTGTIHFKHDAQESLSSAYKQKGTRWRAVKVFWCSFCTVNGGRQTRQGYRICAILALIAGASLAAAVYKRKYWGLAACLYIASGVKLVMFAAVAFWKGKNSSGGDTNGERDIVGSLE